MKKSIPRHIIVKAQNAKDKAKIWGKKKKTSGKGKMIEPWTWKYHRNPEDSETLYLKCFKKETVNLE